MIVNNAVADKARLPVFKVPARARHEALRRVRVVCDALIVVRLPREEVIHRQLLQIRRTRAFVSRHAVVNKARKVERWIADIRHAGRCAEIVRRRDSVTHERAIRLRRDGARPDSVAAEQIVAHAVIVHRDGRPVRRQFKCGIRVEGRSHIDKVPARNSLRQCRRDEVPRRHDLVGKRSGRNALRIGNAGRDHNRIGTRRRLGRMIHAANRRCRRRRKLEILRARRCNLACTGGTLQLKIEREIRRSLHVIRREDCNDVGALDQIVWSEIGNRITRPVVRRSLVVGKRDAANRARAHGVGRSARAAEEARRDFHTVDVNDATVVHIHTEGQRGRNLSGWNRELLSEIDRLIPDLRPGLLHVAEQHHIIGIGVPESKVGRCCVAHGGRAVEPSGEVCAGAVLPRCRRSSRPFEILPPARRRSHVGHIRRRAIAFGCGPVAAVRIVERGVDEFDGRSFAIPRPRPWRAVFIIHRGDHGIRGIAKTHRASVVGEIVGLLRPVGKNHGRIVPWTECRFSPRAEDGRGILGNDDIGTRGNRSSRRKRVVHFAGKPPAREIHRGRAIVVQLNERIADVVEGAVVVQLVDNDSARLRHDGEHEGTLHHEPRGIRRADANALRNTRQPGKRHRCAELVADNGEVRIFLAARAAHERECVCLAGVRVRA